MKENSEDLGYTLKIWVILLRMKENFEDLGFGIENRCEGLWRCEGLVISYEGHNCWRKIQRRKFNGRD